MSDYIHTLNEEEFRKQLSVRVDRAMAFIVGVIVGMALVTYMVVAG